MQIDQLEACVRDIYPGQDQVALHIPQFGSADRAYVMDAIDSTFVSSVGAYVDRLEAAVAEYTGCARAVATVNGTAALHAALHLVGVRPGDFVITQALTFVATCNALSMLAAEPVFVDVDRSTLGMSAASLRAYLEANADADDRGQCIDRQTRRPIRAVVPMHTFGHPVDVDAINDVCGRWSIPVVEDAAESLGSFYKSAHTGTTGTFGTLSFNGNKVVTTGGGGMILCPTAEAGAIAKHVTTTAKVPHAWEFVHDRAGFNYRMPNLNAALGCAQFERLDALLAAKRAIAEHYRQFFRGSEYEFVEAPPDTTPNYWLNAILCPSREKRDWLLEQTNRRGIMTRPVWRLMHHLPMFAESRRADLSVSEDIEARLVNLPSWPAGLAGTSA